MMLHKELTELCKPIEGFTTYYRPFVCKSYKEDNQFTIWIVGTNPATAIKTSDIELNGYAKMLTDYDSFNKYYNEHRVKLNLPPLSKTRERIREFGESLPSYFNIVETNVNAFPTKDTDELFDESIDFSVVKRGWMIFKNILNEFRPNVIVAHGKDTFKFLKQLVQFTPEMNLEKVGLRELQFTGIRYDDHRLSIVIPCTHFSRISHKSLEELHTLVESVSYCRPADRDFNYLKPMPKDCERFEMDLFLTNFEYERLRYGFYPDNDTYWFIYLNDNKIYIHRSSFGYCLFELNVIYDGERFRIVSGLVNRNKEQFDSSNLEENKRFVLDLLHTLFHIWVY